MDDLPIKLANRIFRDSLKAGEVIQFLKSSPDTSTVDLRPNSMAFDLPQLESAALIGGFVRGALADHLLVLASPVPASEIAAFYLNGLRKLGWIYCAGER